MKARILATVLCLTVVAQPAGAAQQRLIVRNEMVKDPAKNLQSYAVNLSLPLDERVQKAPDVFLRYLRGMDKNDSYESYEPTPAERVLIKDYLAKLPETELRVMRERVIGIYFVKNFMGSGWTDCVLDPEAPDKLYLALVLNPEVLQTDISAWVTKKESTAFIPDDTGARVQINCGKDYKGLMYILLHEAAHMVDYAEFATPFVNGDMRTLYALGGDPTPFTQGIWSNYSTPLPQYDFPGRRQIFFYGLNSGPKLKITDALAMYHALESGPFVSLYGSTNWAEDFADFCAYYYLTQKLGLPYEITVYRANAPVFKYAPMATPKVRARFSVVEQILKTAPIAR